MTQKNDDFFLGSTEKPQETKQSVKEEPKMAQDANGTTETQLDLTRKRGMTLKTIPMSLKKIRKVIDEIKERGTPITQEEKFDLGITGSYLSYLAATVQEMVNSAK